MPKQTSLREYDLLASELINRIQREVKPFPAGENTEIAQRKRKERAKNDLLYFCKTYLEHHFEGEWERGHRQIAKTQQVWNKIMVIRGFRGLGKTTMISTGRALQAIAYKESPFNLFLSDDDDTSEMNALAVRVELEHNAKLKNDFGELKGEKWEEGDFITSTGVRNYCKSHRSFKRGARYGSKRPGIVFADDFDTKANCINQDQIDKRFDFMLSELVPAMHNADFQIYFCCNKVARKDTGTQLAEMENTLVVDIPAEDLKSGRPLHPKSFPRKKLDTIRRTIGVKRYNAEFKLRIVSDEDDDFDEKWFVKITQAEAHYKWIVGFLDPAARSGKKNDLKAIVILGYNGKNCDVLWSYGRRSSINQMVRACFSSYKLFGFHRMGVESNGFQILLKDNFKNAISENGFAIPIQMIDSTSNKNAEIMSLQPGVEQGFFRFVVNNNSGDNEKLIDHLLEFNSNTTNNLDDMPDAMAKAWKLIKRMAGISNEAGAEIIE